MKEVYYNYDDFMEVVDKNETIFYDILEQPSNFPFFTKIILEIFGKNLHGGNIVVFRVTTTTGGYDKTLSEYVSEAITELKEKYVKDYMKPGRLEE